MRNEKGLFVQKSKTKRLTKTIRATIEVWNAFGKLAEQRKMSRADLLELWMSDHALHGHKDSETFDVTHGQIDKVIAILEEGLALRANAGGKIKIKIREAIEILTKEE